MRHIFSTLVIGSLLSIMGTKKIGLIGVRPNERLETIAELIGSGKIRPVIDRYYSLEEVPQAMHYLASGSAKGKVVIQVVR